MKTTKITTDYARELTVQHSAFDVNLHVKDTDGFYGGKSEVYTGLSHGEAAQLAAALVGENATVVTDLPEVKVDVDGWVHAGSNGGWLTTSPEKVMRNVKELLAVHAHLVKHNAEQEEAKKAEAEAEAVKAKEAARDKRRDELALELGYNGLGYVGATRPTRNAIDRIIDLEEAAKVS